MLMCPLKWVFEIGQRRFLLVRCLLHLIRLRRTQKLRYMRYVSYLPCRLRPSLRELWDPGLRMAQVDNEGEVGYWREHLVRRGLRLGIDLLVFLSAICGSFGDDRRIRLRGVWQLGEQDHRSPLRRWHQRWFLRCLMRHFRQLR